MLNMLARLADRSESSEEAQNDASLDGGARALGERATESTRVLLDDLGRFGRVLGRVRGEDAERRSHGRVVIRHVRQHVYR